jgi:S-formylglutathione hydrolase FrmB
VVPLYARCDLRRFVFAKAAETERFFCDKEESVVAYYRIEYFSNCLHRTTAFEMLIPNDYRTDLGQKAPETPMRTLFLLHGYTGKAGNWVPEELCVKHNFAVVMPTAENSFYLNGAATGSAYQSMVGEELVDYVRRTFGLAQSAEDTFIAGLSMGGFGALHTALAYPDRFGKAGCLSSAFIVHGIAGMKPGEDDGMANYDYYRNCFGDLEKVLESDGNPETLVKKLKAAGTKIPELYLCCGTEDFLIENNRELHRFFEKEGIPHEYHEGPGTHDMVFWREYIAKIVEWMFG